MIEVTSALPVSAITFFSIFPNVYLSLPLPLSPSLSLSLPRAFSLTSQFKPLYIPAISNLTDPLATHSDQDYLPPTLPLFLNEVSHLLSYGLQPSRRFLSFKELRSWEFTFGGWSRSRSFCRGSHGGRERCEGYNITPLASQTWVQTRRSNTPLDWPNSTISRSLEENVFNQFGKSQIRTCGEQQSEVPPLPGNSHTHNLPVPTTRLSPFSCPKNQNPNKGFCGKEDVAKRWEKRDRHRFAHRSSVPSGSGFLFFLRFEFRLPFVFGSPFFWSKLVSTSSHNTCPPHESSSALTSKEEARERLATFIPELLNFEPGFWLHTVLVHELSLCGIVGREERNRISHKTKVLSTCVERQRNLIERRET